MDYILQAITTHPFNAITLVIALIAALFTGWQALEARTARRANEKAIQTQADAIREQVGLAKESTQASKRSADAAEESAKETKRLSETGQRAWVTY